MRSGTPALSRGQKGESWGLFCSRFFKESGSGELSLGPKQAAPSFPGWDVALLQGAKEAVGGHGCLFLSPRAAFPRRGPAAEPSPQLEVDRWDPGRVRLPGP